MALLPSGFTVPAWPQLVTLVVAVIGTIALLYRVRPPVTQRVVLAFTPWMVAGAGLYALYQVSQGSARVFPPTLAPFFSAPAVYLTTFVGAGLVWATTARFPADNWGLRSGPGMVVTTGGTVAGVVVGLALDVGLAHGGIALFWPLVGLALAGIVAGAVWLLASWGLERVRATGGLGALVVFAHALDGVSTAIGNAHNVPEQSPLSRLILQVGAQLPTAPYVGAGWLFVLVKLTLAVLVVYLLAEGLREDPGSTALVFGFVAAVGLGPGVHNLVLFALSGTGVAAG